MKVNPTHKHLDQSGQVYLPFLHLWSQMTHNLAGLGHELNNAFSEEAPVHAVRQPQAPWGGGGSGGSASVARPYGSGSQPYGSESQHNAYQQHQQQQPPQHRQPPINPYLPTPTHAAAGGQQRAHSPYGGNALPHNHQQQQQGYTARPDQISVDGMTPQEISALFQSGALGNDSAGATSTSAAGSSRPGLRESSEESAVMQQVMKDSLIDGKDRLLKTNLVRKMPCTCHAPAMPCRNALMLPRTRETATRPPAAFRMLT